MTAVGVGVDVGGLLVVVGALWYGSRYLVDGAVGIARRLGLSELVIGLTIVAAGTSTPEVAVSLVALRQGRVASRWATSSAAT